MAALCTGNYGLTQNCIDNSKQYYLVKFTDSALRAVEEYQKNQGKQNTTPTIRIDGNSGEISFPSPGHQWQQFRFTIDEIEGSFQCIKQTQNQLEVQGALPFKLRIHANEDVYETTKHRMAVAEENQKNKCTREIKPNQTDIGRKVKLKNRHANIPPKREPILPSSALPSSFGTASSQSPLNSSTPLCPSASMSSSLSSVPANLNAVSSINHHQYSTGNATTMSPLSTSSATSGYSTSSISPLHSSSLKSSSSSSLSSSNNSNNNSLSNRSLNSSSSSKSHSNYNNNNNGVTSASSLSSALSSAAGSGTSGIASSYYGSSNKGVSGMNSASLMNNNPCRRSVTGTGPNQRNQKNGSRHMPDITKKKLRDRLIHLLALKPYKKPELYNRLQNEGIREREKASISVILKEISTIRDNTYNLKRQMWNDVNEDWPFYTEQELQMLKRRKPQNLTPPISSDGGSSTSGQSPTSTHNGSPPPAVKRPSLDRDRYYEEPIAKKQRISHFRKDMNEINRRSGMLDPRDLPNLISRSKENHETRYSSYYGPTLSKQQEIEDNGMSLSYGVLGSEAARRISPREDFSNLNSHSNSSMSTSHHHSIIPNSHHHINNHNSSNSNNNNNINSSSKHNSINSISNCSSSSSNNNNSSRTHNKSSPLYASSSNVCNTNNNNRLNNSSQQQKNFLSSSSGLSSSSPMLGSSSSSSNSNNNINIGCVDETDNSSIGVMDRQHIPSPTANSQQMIPPLMMNDRGNTSMMMNQCSSEDLTGDKCNDNDDKRNISSNTVRMGSMNATNAMNHNSNGRPNVPQSCQNYDFSHFTSINSVEQRRKYKAEFEKNYAEYRSLLQRIEGVAKKFKMLALQLEENKNNPSTYREIRRKILSEYEITNRDREHQKNKARFDYLHAKLAHIKALVHDFDQTLTSSNGNGNGAMVQSPLQQNSDSMENEHFGNMNPTIKKSPSLSRRHEGGSSSSSSHRSLSSAIMNSNGSITPPGMQHLSSESY